jgi:hypothetical protein
MMQLYLPLIPGKLMGYHKPVPGMISVSPGIYPALFSLLFRSIPPVAVTERFDPDWCM